MKRYCIVCFCFFVVLGCGVLKFNVPKGIHYLAASGDWQAGVARVDLTIDPGRPMSGYGGELGRINRGWWNRLYATSYYIEDPTGQFLIMVTTDLWSVSGGLVDQVLINLKDTLGFAISRESIILTATHSHNAPGNIATSYAYNLASSKMKGFDYPLFYFISKQISSSIAMAIKNKRPSMLFYNQKYLPGLSRNRSLRAFDKNPSQLIQPILTRVGNQNQFMVDGNRCYAETDSVFQAIDPTLTSISFYNKEDTSLFGVMGVFGLHPTAMGHRNELLSADVFGVARTRAESILYTLNNEVIVAFFNGLAGDVSADWYEQDRSSTMRIGEGLAVSIINQLDESQKEFNEEKISVKLKFLKIQNRGVENDLYGELSCMHTGDRKTDKKGWIGIATKVGAEDGRTDKNHNREKECGYEEGKKGECNGRQATKIKDQKLAITLAPSDIIPNKIPLGLYGLGPVIFITVPGEVTVALGERFKKIVNPEMDQPTVVLSLANDYISYLTTPSEYMEQHYEGSSTLYGPASALLLENNLQQLVWRNPDLVNTYFGNKKYNKIPKLLDYERSVEYLLDDIQSNELINGVYNIDENKHSRFDWLIDTSSLFSAELNDELIEVIIEENSNNTWQDLVIIDTVSFRGKSYLYSESQTDRSSNNIIIFLSSGRISSEVKWSSIWIPPPSYKPTDSLRFKLKFADGSEEIGPIDMSIFL